MMSVQTWVTVCHVLGYLMLVWLTVALCIGGIWREENTWYERFFAHFDNLTWKFWLLLVLAIGLMSLKVTPPGA